jgi:hypothetical protein
MDEREASGHCLGIYGGSRKQERLESNQIVYNYWVAGIYSNRGGYCIYKVTYLKLTGSPNSMIITILIDI